MTEKELHKQVLQILTQTQNTTVHLMEKYLRRIEVLIKGNFYYTNSVNPWFRNKVLKKQIENILSECMGHIVKLTHQQIEKIWNLSESFHDQQVADFLLKATGTVVSTDKVYKYFNRQPKVKGKIKISKKELKIVTASPRNREALDAFMQRKINGMNLSEKVWRIFDEGVMPQIESHLAQGIAQGNSVNKLAKDLKPYLDKPDKLFRRIRDKSTGKYKLSVQAQLYNPGRGVYRSSFMNAKRLAVSEVNLAYRTADHHRWQKMDFVLGYDVRRSNTASEPCSLCDPLAGRYPKTFQFPGWHPFCICVATPLLQNKDEFIDSLVSNKPVQQNKIPIPDGMKNWVKKNSDKIKTSKSKPYFVESNPKEISKLLKQF